MYQLPPRQKAILERASSIKIFNGPTLYVFQIFLNWAKPPFDNIKVRQAFNFAIDRETFVKAALAGPCGARLHESTEIALAYDKSVAALYPMIPTRRASCLRRPASRRGT